MGRGARNPHPEQLARCTDEIDTGGHEFRDAVVKETLRLRPMLSLVGRRLKAPMDVGGESHATNYVEDRGPVDVGPGRRAHHAPARVGEAEILEHSAALVVGVGIHGRCRRPAMLTSALSDPCRSWIVGNLSEYSDA